MKSKWLVVSASLMIAALVLPLLFPGFAAAARAQGSPACSIDFEAAVRQGPSMGTALNGKLSFDIADDGSLMGNLVTTDNKTIPVVGQVNNRAISLGFELQKVGEQTEGMYIFGTGLAWLPIAPESQCGAIMGGTFAGPMPGDLGDWFTCIGYRTEGGGCIGISY